MPSSSVSSTNCSAELEEVEEDGGGRECEEESIVVVECKDFATSWTEGDEDVFISVAAVEEIFFTSEYEEGVAE